MTIAHSHSTSSGSGLAAVVKDILQKPLKSNSVDHLFACSEAAGEWLFGSKNMNAVSILKNSIDANKFVYNEITRVQVRRNLAIDQRFVIGHVGSFIEPKNHMFLIDIFKEIHEKNNKSVLMLVGRGELSEKVTLKVKELGLEDSVMFMGIRTDIPELLQAMDVFLFPSLYEGLPLTLVEAQAAGLIVIASDKITEEINLTNLVKFISLERPASYWAEKLFQYTNSYKRRNTHEKICEAGYDVKENAKWLEEFYLNEYKRNK
jgi:glycosyltransferase involved in cell wall biosynthesis